MRPWKLGGAIVVGLLLVVAGPAHALTCDATGTFEFISGAGAGDLTLEPIGPAFSVGFATLGLFQSPGAPPMTGSYEVIQPAPGTTRCIFAVAVEDATGHRIEFGGVVAFNGLILMFELARTDPRFAVGLAIRNGMFRPR